MGDRLNADGTPYKKKYGIGRTYVVYGPTPTEPAQPETTPFPTWFLTVNSLKLIEYLIVYSRLPTPRRNPSLWLPESKSGSLCTEEEPQKQLETFKSHISSSCKTGRGAHTHITLNAGGPVFGLAWCPIPKSFKQGIFFYTTNLNLTANS